MMLQDITILEEQYTLDVLMTMGHQLMKEYQLSEYIGHEDVIMEGGTTSGQNATSLFRRAVDFFTRILTQFIAWIRKGQLKEARKVLTRMKNSKITSNHHKPDGEEDLNTMFWDINWYQNNVVRVIQDFNNSPLMNMMTQGDIINYDRTNIQQHITRAERDQRRLNNLYRRMISPAHHPRATIFTHNMIDQLIRDTIDFGTQDIYNNLKKSRETIRAINHSEKEYVNQNDSRRVAQQWTRALTVFGNCCAEVLRILQTITTVLTHGAVMQSNPITRTGPYSGVERNLTVDRLKTIIRNNIFASHPQAATNGVSATINDEFNDKGKCYIRLDWPGGNSIISCNKLNATVTHFLLSHPVIMPADVT